MAFNTIVLGLLVSFLAIPLGVVLGRICGRSSFLSRVTFVLCCSFLFVPLFVFVGAWDAAFGKLGWLSSFNSQSFRAEPWLMTVWIHSVAAVPQIAILYWVAERLTDNAAEQQAELDVSSVTVFFYFTVPRLLPVIAACFVWILITCSREISVTDIYRIETIAERIYLGYSLDSPDVAGQTYFPILLVVFISLLTYISVALFFWNQANLHDGLNARRKQPRSSILELLVAASVLVAVFVLPILNLVVRASRFVVSDRGDPVICYSVQNLVQNIVYSPLENSSEFLWSIGLASLSSVLILNLAIFLSWKALESRSWKFFNLVVFSMTCGLPGPLIGSTLLNLRSSFANPIFLWLFDRTLFAPIVANLIFCWPLGFTICIYFLSKMPTNALENAKLEGASGFQRLLMVAKANLPGLVTAAIIVFAICFGELSASQLVVPPGIDTLPRRMLGLLHSGVNDSTAGLILFVLFINLAVVSLGLGVTEYFKLKRV